MVLGVQLAFHAFGVADVVLQYEARTIHRRECPGPAISWRQMSLWDADQRSPRKRRGPGGQYMRGTPIYRLRLPAASPALRQRRPSNELECRRLGLGETVPCPWFGCRYHLGRDGGSLVWRSIDPAAHECCALVVARHRARTPREVADLLSCSVQLVEATYRSAVRKLRVALGDGTEHLGAAILRMRGTG